jgi:glutamate/tyrosine decarboxylase-like PLP-dependent enzyme
MDPERLIPLHLETDDLRKLGQRVVDMLLEHWQSLPSKPVTRWAEPATMRQAFHEPLPEQGTDPFQLLDMLETSLFTQIMHVDHPRFFAFVPSPGNPLSALASLLAAGHNVFAGTWLEASAAAQIELTTLDWLRQLCGLPPWASGIFTSGGSMANLTALAVARESKVGPHSDRAVVYSSDQTHSSVARALRVLGFGAEQYRQLETDDTYRLVPESLARQLASDCTAGLKPVAIVANAGTTNTGAVDPLPELAELARLHQVWLHVDASFGAPAILSSEGRRVLAGLGLADSITLDPHKWLFQPFDCGCLLVRTAEMLEQTFRVLPEYLRDVTSAEGEVNFCDRGIELTRPFRALKLWMTFKSFGSRAIASAIERGLALARLAEEEIRARGNWRVVTPAQLGIVTFRYELPGGGPGRRAELHRALIRACIQDGTLMISSTELRGETVLRMCTLNPRTTDADIRRSVGQLDELARKIAQRMPEVCEP